MRRLLALALLLFGVGACTFALLRRGPAPSDATETGAESTTREHAGEATPPGLAAAPRSAPADNEHPTSCA